MVRAPVTALIATCNRAHFLRQALDSVLAQTLPPDQIIVVNDGSTDGTCDVLRDYDGRVEVMEQPNGGKSHAINNAMPRVRGMYLWIFDDDDIALPKNLENHLAALEEDPEIDFVFSGGTVVIDRPDGRLEHKDAIAIPEVPENEIFPRMLEGNFMQQQAMLVRTQCYRDIGPFDTRLDRGQDYEMNLRLCRRFSGKRLTSNSFLFRQHDGPRGRPIAPITSKERRRRWVDVNRRLLLGLRDEIALEEYLPRDLRTGDLDPSRRFRALLQRACVMSRCGLWTEALADYSDALLDRTSSGIALGPAEQAICARALGKYIDYDVAIEGLLDDRAHERDFRRLLAEAQQQEIVPIFARQLNRYIMRRWAKGDRLRALQALRLTFGIRPAGGFRALGAILGARDQAGLESNA